MSNIVKFVSCDYVKQNTVIEFNVDDSKITPLILKVQKVYLEETIGSSFYNHLVDALTNSTLTAAETNMLREYVKPMIAEYVAYEAIPTLNFKLTNKSMVKQDSEWSEASQLDEVKYMRNITKDVAELYAHRLHKYLCDNSSDFPEWTNKDLPENVRANGKSFFGGVYLPKRNNDCC